MPVSGSWSVRFAPAGRPPWRGRLDADLQAAELLGQLVEADDVRHDEVVDVHAGDRLDGLDLEQLARLVGGQVPLGLGHVGVVGLVERLVVGVGVGRVDLALGEPVVGGVRVVDDVVAGDREADRLLPAGEDVDQDQRVGVLRALKAGLDRRLVARVRLGSCRTDKSCPWKVVRLSSPMTRMFIAPADGALPSLRRRDAERVGQANDLVGVAGHREGDGSGHARDPVADVAYGDRTELRTTHAQTPQP